MDGIPGTSGFQYYEVKYVWLCRACGATHEETPPRCAPGLPPWIPSVPEGWLVLTRRIGGDVMDAYCPAHRVVVQDNEVDVYAKEDMNA